MYTIHEQICTSMYMGHHVVQFQKINFSVFFLRAYPKDKSRLPYVSGILATKHTIWINVCISWRRNRLDVIYILFAYHILLKFSFWLILWYIFPPLQVHLFFFTLVFFHFYSSPRSVRPFVRHNLHNFVHLGPSRALAEYSATTHSQTVGWSSL